MSKFKFGRAKKQTIGDTINSLKQGIFFLCQFALDIVYRYNYLKNSQ